MNRKKITGVADPNAGSDVATKGYVDKELFKERKIGTININGQEKIREAEFRPRNTSAPLNVTISLSDSPRNTINVNIFAYLFKHGEYSITSSTSTNMFPAGNKQDELRYFRLSSDADDDNTSIVVTTKSLFMMIIPTLELYLNSIANKPITQNFNIDLFEPRSRSINITVHPCAYPRDVVIYYRFDVYKYN